MPIRALRTAFAMPLAAVLAACAQPVSRLAESTPGPASDPVATATMLPAATGTPSPTPTPPATPTPTLHPLTIGWLRSQGFPASEIQIEQTLPPGSNYSRYVASYRSEGLKIFALLTIPLGDVPPTGWPAIVFNHGFIPPDEYRTTERYVAYVDGFARNGYIVFRSDYRGHGESEGIARGGYGSPDYTIDVLNAVAALRAYPQADPDRIGMWGHSMGGFITLRSLVVSPDIRAGVIWAGVVAPYADLFRGWRRPFTGGATPTPRPGSWRVSIVELFGSPEENPEFWNSLSANSYLADLAGPVQLHHGTADSSVPVEFSLGLFEQIQAVDGTVELYEYVGDDHNLSIYFTTAMRRSVEFFDRYLKGPSS